MYANKIDNYSKIPIILSIQEIMKSVLYLNSQSLKIYNRFIIMRIILIFAFFSIETVNFLVSQRSNPAPNNYPFLTNELKYNGKGFTTSLQVVLAEAISDAAIYFKDDYYSQATFINKKMNDAQKGIWHVIIIQNMNISKITDVSTGFFYWCEADTWALWFSTTPFTKEILHLVIFNGEERKSLANVSTKSSQKGSDISSQLADVIKSIVQSLDTTQDIAKYIQKYDGRKWSVLSTPFQWGGKYPEAWASLSVDGTYLSYNKNVTMGGKNYSQIIYV